MKFFLDTANTDQVAEIAAWGVLDGVTTNPSLVAKEGKDFKQTILKMCELVPCVSAQVTATTAEEMIKQGKEYSSWHKNIVVKVPMGTDGLKALGEFKKLGIKTNTTLVFSSAQAMLAAKAGATIVSIFIGRHFDAGQDGMQLVEETMDIWNQYGFEAEVLVASMRHAQETVQCARLGAHICTIKYEHMKQMPLHPMTDVGLQKFMDDWKKVKTV